AAVQGVHRANQLVRAVVPAEEVGSRLDSEEDGMVLVVLKVIAAALTIVTGLVSLVRPRSVTGFTGLQPVGGRGVTEIRAVLGGFFIGLGAAPLILGAD